MALELRGIIQLTQTLFVTLILLLFAHLRIGNYPPQLPRAKNSRRELLEVLLIWATMLLSTSYLMLASYVFPLYYPFIEFGGRFLPILHIFIMFQVPILVEVFINRRSRSELGFSLPTSWVPALVLVGFGAYAGILEFLYEPHTPYPFDYLLLGLLTPALSEEWVYRSVIQQKLERAAGQTRAWLFGGMLYGLVHVPTDFFGTIWVASGLDPLNALLRLIGQCTFGWLWGVLYIKSRSIIPVVLSHYLMNYLAGILPYISILQHQN